MSNVRNVLVIFMTGHAYKTYIYVYIYMYYISMYICIQIYIQNTHLDHLIYTVYIHLYKYLHIYIYTYVRLLILFQDTYIIYTPTAWKIPSSTQSTPSQDGSGQLEPSELIDGFLTWETLRAVRQDRRFDVWRVS